MSPITLFLKIGMNLPVAIVIAGQCERILALNQPR